MSLPQRRESRSQCGLESLPSAVLARALPASTLGEAFPAGAARLRLRGRCPGRRAQLQSPRAQLGWREPRRGREETPHGRALPSCRAVRSAASPEPWPRPPWLALPGSSPFAFRRRDREMSSGRLPQLTRSPALLADSPVLSVSQAGSGVAALGPRALEAPGQGRS